MNNFKEGEWKILPLQFIEPAKLKGPKHDILIISLNTILLNILPKLSKTNSIPQSLKTCNTVKDSSPFRLGSLTKERLNFP